MQILKPLIEFHGDFKKYDFYTEQSRVLKLEILSLQ